MVRCRGAPMRLFTPQQVMYNKGMRSLRTVVAVLALLLIVAGTAFAARTSLDRHQSPLAASNQPSGSEKGDGSEAPESEAPESEAPESEAPESEAPESPDTNDSESGAQLSDAHAAELVDLLKAAGITATAAELKTLVA